MNQDISKWKTEIILMLNKTLDLIKKNGLVLKKKYGQNFLIDDNIMRKIISALELNKDDLILEIGPGLGILTENFLIARKIILIEIDETAAIFLKNKFDKNKNVKVMNSDILKIDLEKLFEGEKNIKIVSNLPYYISTAVITKCLEMKKNIDLKFMVFMMQKEVAERILSAPNKKSYGSLSVFAQYKSDISFVEKNVSPNCFLPTPKVNSSIIKFVPKNNFETDDTEQKFLFSLVKKSFSKRRKTLINCLDNFCGLSKNEIANVLAQNNLDLNIRAESMTINDFIKLSFGIKKIIYRSKKL